MSNYLTGEPAYYLSTSADRAARRERIATAALQGLMSKPHRYSPRETAEVAITFADALIAELDKEPQP